MFLFLFLFLILFLCLFLSLFFLSSSKLFHDNHECHIRWKSGKRLSPSSLYKIYMNRNFVFLKLPFFPYRQKQGSIKGISDIIFLVIQPVLGSKQPRYHTKKLLTQLLRHECRPNLHRKVHANLILICFSKNAKFLRKTLITEVYRETGTNKRSRLYLL